MNQIALQETRGSRSQENTILGSLADAATLVSGRGGLAAGLCRGAIRNQVQIVFVVGFSSFASSMQAKTMHIVGCSCNSRERYVLHLNPGARDHTSR